MFRFYLIYLKNYLIHCSQMLEMWPLCLLTARPAETVPCSRGMEKSSSMCSVCWASGISSSIFETESDTWCPRSWGFNVFKNLGSCLLYLLQKDQLSVGDGAGGLLSLSRSRVSPLSALMADPAGPSIHHLNTARPALPARGARVF